MLDKPALDDEQIAACLWENYALTAAEIEFLPLGYDSDAGVYRVRADGQDYFLKATRAPINALSVTLPPYLKTHGIEEVIAPLPTVTQALWGRIESYAILLYPYIEGKSGMELGLSDDQWIAFGAILKRLHATRLPANLLSQLPVEDFIPHPRWTAVVRELQQSVSQRVTDHPIEKQVAAFWMDKHQEIDRVIARADQLGAALRARPSEWVVCHADIHTGNLLIDARGRLFVVDWDQPILAPKERDLMFVTAGGFVTEPRHEAFFFQGYGDTGLDAQMLAYYRYARVLEDIGAFAERALAPDSSDETKRDSLMWLMRQFEPNSVLAAAYQADREASV
jgi:spectinomycin phosphotransferase